jgi:hypothetical protein
MCVLKLLGSMSIGDFMSDKGSFDHHHHLVPITIKIVNFRERERGRGVTYF